MKIVEIDCRKFEFKGGVIDRLNDLATSACQKMASMPIGNLYTGYSIFRINPKNLLIQFKEFDETANLIRSASYAYDALGRRIEKVVTDLQISQNNKTRRYVYDGEDILKVFDENNQVLSKYTHSSLRLDDALAIDDKANSKSYYFLKDHLGSIVDIVSEDNTFKQHYAYSSFGELQKVTDINGNDVTLNPILEHHFAYTGREFDQESGLYHYRARAYDASSGRFLQVDPHPGAMLDPLTNINKYIYVTNSPLARKDPSGRFSFLASLTNFVKVNSTAVTAGFFGAYYSYKDAKSSGASFIQTFASTAVGGVIAGTVSAFSASVIASGLLIGGPVGAALGYAASVPLAYAGAFFNNGFNQLIYNKGNVDLDRAFKAGESAAIIQSIALLMTPVLGPAFSAGFSGIAATCVDNGIITKEKMNEQNSAGTFSCEALLSY